MKILKIHDALNLGYNFVIFSNSNVASYTLVTPYLDASNISPPASVGPSLYVFLFKISFICSLSISLGIIAFS